MVVFETKSGTVYSLDTEKNILNGGHFHDLKYYNANVFIGQQAIIALDKDFKKLIYTSKVERFL